MDLTSPEQWHIRMPLLHIPYAGKPPTVLVYEKVEAMIYSEAREF
jgi:hypothetical protein